MDGCLVRKAETGLEHATGNLPPLNSLPYPLWKLFIHTTAQVQYPIPHSPNRLHCWPPCLIVDCPCLNSRPIILSLQAASLEVVLTFILFCSFVVRASRSLCHLYRASQTCQTCLCHEKYCNWSVSIGISAHALPQSRLEVYLPNGKSKESKHNLRRVNKTSNNQLRTPAEWIRAHASCRSLVRMLSRVLSGRLALSPARYDFALHQVMSR